MQKWHILGKNIKKFQFKSTDFDFVFSNLKLLIEATNKGGLEKYSTIPFGI